MRLPTFTHLGCYDIPYRNLANYTLFKTLLRNLFGSSDMYRCDAKPSPHARKKARVDNCLNAIRLFVVRVVMNCVIDGCFMHLR